jgi:4,5:9,10-diseco-3-hydroxy-5,9,17-trioxoandrosta-1(10),2-diene-4-oate hydrolase
MPPDVYVSVGHVATRYCVAGEYGPPVVLIHGFGGGAEDWAYNITALATRHRVYALDLVGCGRTDKPAIRHSLPNFARFVAAFLTTVGVERAHLVGHSMGGAVALTFARLFPNRLHSLVLVSSAGLGSEVSTGSRLATMPLLGDLLIRPGRLAIKAYLRQAIFDRAMITEQAVSILVERGAMPGARASALAILRALVSIRGARREVVRSLVENLATIAAPTLVVWGENDRVVPVARGELAARAIPDAELRVFARCGHAPQYECADAFNALILAFCDGTPGH